MNVIRWPQQHRSENASSISTPTPTLSWSPRSAASAAYARFHSLKLLALLNYTHCFITFLPPRWLVTMDITPSNIDSVFSVKYASSSNIRSIICTSIDSPAPQSTECIFNIRLLRWVRSDCPCYITNIIAQPRATCLRLFLDSFDGNLGNMGFTNYWSKATIPYESLWCDSGFLFPMYHVLAHYHKCSGMLFSWHIHINFLI